MATLRIFDTSSMGIPSSPRLSVLRTADHRQRHHVVFPVVGNR
jgi:hypothetical protein